MAEFRLARADEEQRTESIVLVNVRDRMAIDRAVRSTYQERLMPGCGAAAAKCLRLG